MTDNYKSWFNLWEWHDIDYHDGNRWNKQKNDILYNGLDMEAAYHAGYQDYKSERMNNIDLEAKISKLEALLGANVRVMKLEIKKELEEEAEKAKEQLREKN